MQANIYIFETPKEGVKNQCEDKPNCSLCSVSVFFWYDKVLSNVFFSILSIYTVV